MLYKLDIIQEKGIERENRASISSQRYAKFLMISNLLARFRQDSRSQQYSQCISTLKESVFQVSSTFTFLILNTHALSHSPCLFTRKSHHQHDPNVPFLLYSSPYMSVCMHNYNTKFQPLEVRCWTCLSDANIIFTRFIPI